MGLAYLLICDCTLRQNIKSRAGRYLGLVDVYIKHVGCKRYLVGLITRYVRHWQIDTG